ncbi:MAG: winged helix-turn-helix domain-containing protein [Dysgonomonas sp.]
MLKNDIGINAGAIWRLLSEKGKLSLKEIVEFTNYKEYYILLALGWLSRESKVSFSDKKGVLYVELDNHYMTEIYY